MSTTNWCWCVARITRRASKITVGKLPYRKKPSEFAMLFDRLFKLAVSLCTVLDLGGEGAKETFRRYSDDEQNICVP